MIRKQRAGTGSAPYGISFIPVFFLLKKPSVARNRASDGFFPFSFTVRKVIRRVFFLVKPFFLNHFLLCRHRRNKRVFQISYFARISAGVLRRSDATGAMPHIRQSAYWKTSRHAAIQPGYQSVFERLFDSVCR